ncbi:lysylphosphatidylglycerol synthase domain-containing protein [Rhizobium sullae]|uniref:Lysylphosphatidylglycerol synthase domain-containing protein n=1 Tax=Rhizobium sullae TaxID=50338 RepID=A0A2N0D6X0_RHISU|nr:lysylphosphatidylglycerol synthase domain-containing protein [Rhizobium sullae]PKA41841.1 lysylphosphatidylglycerol synthetase family protein [Rhizobium sullae]UWU13554.1 lysylphosphatidylglycerol synthase domain-containing protein [Rhizobium sullae]
MSIKRVLINAALVLCLMLAAYLLYRVFSRYTLSDVMESICAIPGTRILGSLGFAAASYLCLTGFDWMALRYAGKPLSYRKAALTSFTSLSIGHNLGFAALSSGAVRYRFYSRWGLNAEEVAKVILFCGATVGIGLSTLAGIVLLINPEDAANLLKLSPAGLFALGCVCLSLPAVYIVLSVVIRTPLHLWKWAFEMPRPKLALGQVVIGTLNFIFVAACLHQMLAAQGETSYVQTATAYVLANIAVLIAHVPGGLGVIEATVSYVLPGAASIGALVAFRAIYFLFPLLIGLPAFAISEAVIPKRKQVSSEDRSQQSTHAQTQLL